MNESICQNRILTKAGMMKGRTKNAKRLGIYVAAVRKIVVETTDFQRSSSGPVQYNKACNISPSGCITTSKAYPSTRWDIAEPCASNPVDRKPLIRQFQRREMQFFPAPVAVDSALSQQHHQEIFDNHECETLG